MIQKYKYKIINGKPELILIEEIDSVITIKGSELNGFTFEESEKHYAKIKKVKVYPHCLSDKDMILATGKWYGVMLIDAKLKLKKPLKSIRSFLKRFKPL